MSASTRHFARHYVEMLGAMFLGMTVLGVPAVAALSVVVMSPSELHNDAPALLAIEHVVMPLSMLLAMLLRRDEYTGAVHHRRWRQATA